MITHLRRLQADIRRKDEALRDAIADRNARQSEGKYGYSLLTDKLEQALLPIENKEGE